jgi:hypothetical protein
VCEVTDLIAVATFTDEITQRLMSVKFTQYLVIIS